MSRLHYHLDEDCQASALAAALREHGLEVTTTNEAGLCGADDEAQLAYAARLGAVIVSNNICDFAAFHARWHAESRKHSGIVLFPQQGYTIGEIVRRLAHLRRTLSAEQMQGRLEWLSAWGSR